MIELQVVSLYLLKLWATSSWVLSRWDRTIPRNFEDCRLHCRHLKSLWAFSVFHLKEKHVLWWHLGGGGNRGQPECKRFAGRWRFFDGRVRVVNSCKNVVPPKAESPSKSRHIQDRKSWSLVICSSSELILPGLISYTFTEFLKSKKNCFSCKAINAEGARSLSDC